jgi:hypothetical protein
MEVSEVSDVTPGKTPSHVQFFIVDLSMFPIVYVSYKVPLVYDVDCISSYILKYVICVR